MLAHTKKKNVRINVHPFRFTLCNLEFSGEIVTLLVKDLRVSINVHCSSLKLVCGMTVKVTE